MAANEVSKCIAPDGNTYHYKDEKARNSIGILEQLKTENKADLVSAINELKEKIQILENK